MKKKGTDVLFFTVVPEFGYDHDGLLRRGEVIIFRPSVFHDLR